VSTTLAMMAMVTPDMLSETTVHIAGDDAVAVGPGYRWAVGVSFRKMNRPHPSVVSVVNAGSMSPSA